MAEIDNTDRTTYAPFVLMDEGKYRSLFLSDQFMADKFQIFDERAAAGWTGNGYDWNAIAQVVVAEQLPDLKDQFTYDPEAGMFSASGPRLALERLGTALQAVFQNDATLRELLKRVQPND